MISEKARAIIETAIEVIQATGWTAGRIGEIAISKPDQDGKHCAIGALAAGAHICGESVGQERPSTFQQGATFFDPYLEKGDDLAYSKSDPYIEATLAVWENLPKMFRRALRDEYTGRFRYSRVTADIFEWNDAQGIRFDEEEQRSFKDVEAGTNSVLELLERTLQNS